MRILRPSRQLPSVYHGLALEELLLSHSAETGPTLMIWKGPAAVVMGKNQNPWREINLLDVEREGIPLARRISGGGTVYHDPGNLNLSWILPREGYREATVTDLLKRSLRDLGFDPQPGVSGGLRLEGKKVSGAAFCYRKDQVLHHGTLLLSADLQRMRRALAPPRLHLETHAVRSIPAQVANLQDLKNSVTEEKVVEALLHSTEEEWGPLSEIPSPEVDIETLEHLQSVDWCWGQTPTFVFETTQEGPLHLKATVRKGMASEWIQDGTHRNDIPPAAFRSSSIPFWADHLGLRSEDVTSVLEASGFRLP